MASDKEGCGAVRGLSEFCLESYNHVVSSSALKRALRAVEPVYASNLLKISLSDVCMGRLSYPPDTRKCKRTVLPSEARLRSATYLAELDVQLSFEHDRNVEYCWRKFYVPAMVKSNLCYLKDLEGQDLVKAKEDINDPGGYFIVKGKEKIIRHFLVPKRNYPLSLMERSWKRGDLTEYRILIRSVKDEVTFSNTYLHWMVDGDLVVRLRYRFTSVTLQAALVLQALCPKTHRAISLDILKYCKDFPPQKLKSMLLNLQAAEVYTQTDARLQIGKCFQPLVRVACPSLSYLDIADFVLKRLLLPHLDEAQDKYEFLCFCVCKLHCVVSGQCRLDDLDNPVYQEVLSCAQIYALILKLGVSDYMKSVKNSIEKSISSKCFSFQKDILQRLCNRSASLSPQVTSSLSTGNFPGKWFGLGSNTGYSVSLKRNNVFDLAAQFTAVCKFPVPHYAAFGRSFYPEAYGFLCPSQTPEGENTGLHNYLASDCKIVSPQEARMSDAVFFRWGVVPPGDPVAGQGLDYRPFIVDGRVCGWIHQALEEKLALHIRQSRNREGSRVAPWTEVVSLDREWHGRPCVHVFTSPCRFLRKYVNAGNGNVEYIGMFESLFLGSLTKLSEPRATSFLSLSVAMIPFLENNESTRNIFSSVKVRQALGVPFHNFRGRADSKVFHLVSAQLPAVSSQLYQDSQFALYPHGTNVTVALLSYSGYDLEDAVVLSRSSVDRGLLHHVVHKTLHFDYEELARDFGPGTRVSDIELARDLEGDPFVARHLDRDGLPAVGARLHPNCPLLSVYCRSTGDYKIYPYPGRSAATVTAVWLSGDVPASHTNIPRNSKKISIAYCTRSVPEVGDKLSNRHGDKGVCGALLSGEDLPFTDQGLVPDLLINPHGFPSRRAVGLLLEIAAAKAHLTLGSRCVVEPFQGSQSNRTYENIGQALREAGFDSYGTERFFSGTSGEELEAEVFCGCAYYLRLHHFAKDKYQVHSVGGEVDPRTHQPLNAGLSGAVRFGEMERDAIVSHGAAALTLDRLLLASDACAAYVCSECGHLSCPVLPPPLPEWKRWERRRPCELCSADSCVPVRVPYVLLYLTSELSVLGLRLHFSIQEEETPPFT